MTQNSKPWFPPFDWLNKSIHKLISTFYQRNFASLSFAPRFVVSKSLSFLSFPSSIRMLIFRTKGDANDLVLGTSIGFNLDQQSNGSHIYLTYHNGDSMIRKCFAVMLEAHPSR